jgi:hypothetical protein
MPSNADDPECETRGTVSPPSWEDAETHYEEFGATAQSVVRELARALSFDREEYETRVDSDVVETARQTLFAERLAVRLADRATFDEWREEYSHSVRVAGSDNVSRVAWHDSPAASAAVAATFENEPDAAVGTVRRMAFNRLYRDRLTADSDGDTTKVEQ